MAAIKGLSLQQPHTDIRGLLNIDTQKLIAGVTVALSLIIALDDETSLTYYSDTGGPDSATKVKIPKCSMFIFSADLIHSGMGCKTQNLNLRLHAILALPEYHRGGKTQGWLVWLAEENRWSYVAGCE